MQANQLQIQFAKFPPILRSHVSAPVPARDTIPSKSNWADQNLEIRDMWDKQTSDGRTDVDTFRARFVSRWQSVTLSPARLENVPLLVQGRDEGVYDFYKRVLARIQAVGAKDETAPRNVYRQRAVNALSTFGNIPAGAYAMKDCHLRWLRGALGP